jgi:deazaflavin-dependent oxidoreductase (nitroreductase family)
LKRINPNSSSKDSNLTREPYLYLTTRGRNTGLPREIEIWFTHRDGSFYVIAEYPTSNWVQNLRADPKAEVRVGKQRFTVQARVVSDPELHHAIAELSTKKYGWGEGTIVELLPNDEPRTDNQEL